MKKIIFLIAITHFQTSYSQNLTEKIATSADKIESKVIEWRHDFHQNPELSNRETRTAGIIAAHLKKLGIEVQTGVAKTGVVGILKGNKPSPVVALRADMDALPVVERVNIPFASKAKSTFNGKEVGVMHACGHDAHVAILMGVAEVLANMKSDLKGTVKFIFQPAEEGTPDGEEGGADLMIKEGVLENPKVDVIFGLHMNSRLEVGNLSVRTGGMMASAAGLKIVVKGKSTHGAMPWAGVDPILVSAQIINNLQSIVSRNVNLSENAAVVSIGSIHGGNRGNIIPEEVEMIGTVRSLSNEDEKMIYEKIRQIATKTAEMYGATAAVELPYLIRYPVTLNDKEITTMMLPSLQKSVGIENVLSCSPNTASEDFAFYSQKIPGMFFNLGGMTKGRNPQTAPPHHSPDFEIDDSGFKSGVKALTNLVFDYMDKKN